MTAGKWPFTCLNAALQSKTEQRGRTASHQLLQSVPLFMASCCNSPALLMGNKRKYKTKYLHPSSKKFCYGSTRDSTSAVKLETSSHMCSLESAKASLPKARLPWRCVHELPSWTSLLPAPTEAVVIRRLLLNTIPPEGFWCCPKRAAANWSLYARHSFWGSDLQVCNVNSWLHVVKRFSLVQ